MNTNILSDCKENKQFMFSFGVQQNDNTEECDLSDEFLGENAQANIPISINNLNKNMQRTAKSKNGGSFCQPNLEFDKDTKIRSKLLSTTINHSVLFESQTSSTKRNLKDDISYLLRRLINEKKKQTVLVDQINEHQRNHEQYVTMKEIPSIDIE